jgi:hypothetical protein
MIAGGGKVGLRLAREIRATTRSRSSRPSARAATTWPRSCRRRAGAARRLTDEDLMGDENVQDMDLFLALTSDDEDNIMACLLAKRMGARRVLALINRKAYADLVQGTQIDIAISPSHMPSSANCWPMCGAATSRPCTACAAVPPRRWKASCAATRKTCRMAGRRIEEIGLPAGAQIGAIVRGLHRPTAARSAGPRGRRSSSPTTTPWCSQRPRHRLRAAQAHGARGGKAVPGQRHLLASDRGTRWVLLAVFALLGGMVVLFALLMLVPLAFAWVGNDAALHALRTGHRASRWPPARLFMSLPAALPARTAAARRLPAGDADLGRAAGLRRAAAAAGDARA